MASNTLNNLKILHKRYITEEWVNHKLQAGELGLNLTTKQVRIGTAANQAWADATPVGVKVVVNGTGPAVKSAVLDEDTNTLTLTLGYISMLEVSNFDIADDDVVNLSASMGNLESGENIDDLYLRASHAKKGPSSGYTSGNTKTEIKTANTDHVLKIPQLTVDAYGHVTAAEDKNVTINIKNTTYTLSTGDADGQVKITPVGGGPGQNAPVNGWDALVNKVNGNTSAYTYRNRTDPAYIAALKDKTKFKVGDTIYFVDTNVPDQWVGAVLATADEDQYWYTLYDIQIDTAGVVHGTNFTPKQVVIANPLGGSGIETLIPGAEGSILRIVKGVPKWDPETPAVTYGAEQGVELNSTTHKFRAALKDYTLRTDQASRKEAEVKNNHYYAVELDKDNKLAVNVPWENATYTANNGIKLSGTVFSADLRNAAKATITSTYTKATDTAKFYSVQLDKDGKLGVEVPWIHTTYTNGVGLVLNGTQFAAKLKNTTASTHASTYTAGAATKFYSVQVDKDGYLAVNVPWTDTHITYSAATSSTLGLVKLGSDAKQTEAANTPSTTANRTYAVQFNNDQQLVVNVPWTDTNTTYGADRGISLVNGNFGHDHSSIIPANNFFGVVNLNEYGHVTSYVPIDTLDGNDATNAA